MTPSRSRCPPPGRLPAPGSSPPADRGGGWGPPDLEIIAVQGILAGRSEPRIPEYPLRGPESPLYGPDRGPGSEARVGSRSFNLGDAVAQ